MSDAVVFDIDGTLVDSTYHHAIAWQRAFDRVHLPVPLWRIHRSVGMGGDKLVSAVAGESIEQRFGDDLRSLWHEEYLSLRAEVYPLAGATDLVRGLIGDGCDVALASSGDPEFSREAVALLGLRHEVHVLTTSEDADASKPDPDLIGVTLARLGDVERAVVVGDTPYDVVSAARAGLGCISLRSGGYGEAELLEAGALLVANGPADLIGLDWERYFTAPGSDSRHHLDGQRPADVAVGDVAEQPLSPEEDGSNPHIDHSADA